MWGRRWVIVAGGMLLSAGCQGLRPEHTGVSVETGAVETGLEQDTETDTLPVDCEGIAVHPAWEVCHADLNRCEAVYTDAAGCETVCAAVGLTCTGAYENRSGSCAPDVDRPALSCNSGHQSDYCICGGDGLPTVDDPGVSRFEDLLSERAGFGEKAKGGDPNLVYTVTTLADSGTGSLRHALESEKRWSIQFAVDGHITWEEDVRIRSYKTVDGRGRNITVDGTWRMQDVHDVILSDLSVTRSIRTGRPGFPPPRAPFDGGRGDCTMGVAGLLP